MVLSIIVAILAGGQVVEIMERGGKKDMSMIELIETRDWYFTFGCGQEHAGYYVKITAPYNIARGIMFKKYGSKWSFQYGDNEYEDCIACWDYKELEHITEEPIIVDVNSNNKPNEQIKEDI